MCALEELSKLKAQETTRRNYNLRTHAVAFRPYHNGTRRKPHLEWRYNLLICTIFVFMDAYIKIEMISNFFVYLFGQQLTEYPS
jgi:hypothetical protein